MVQKRPNFLLIITDQQRADYLGCAGHPVLKTPNIDRIAEGGVRFDKFYVANPVCMPNRSTLMTGRMPSSHGVRSNGIPLPLESNTFTDILRWGGYRTALVGKSHLQNFTGMPALQTREQTHPGRPVPEGDLAEARRPGDPSDYLYEDPSSWLDPAFELPNPFYGFEHVDLCTLHGDMVGADYRRWLLEKGVEPSEIVGRKNALAHDYICPQAWRTAVPEALYPSAFVAERTIGYLDRHVESGEDNPFFVMMSIPDPHHPFTPPGRYWDMYRPEDAHVPESFFDMGNNPPPTLAWALEERAEGKAVRDQGQFLFVVNEREAREAIALTYGMMACVDDAVGKVLNHLDTLGLSDDTVVLYTSDHGDFLGAHRLLLKGPIHYQSVIRVPFLWRDPGSDQAGTACDALCGTVDLAPTILDRAGLSPYNGMQGRSLLPEAADLLDHGPGCVLVEDDQQRTVLGFASSPRVHTLVDGRWRMSIYDGADWGELYDLEADPLENHNRWSDSAFSETKAALLEAFVRREIALVDRSPLPSARA